MTAQTNHPERYLHAPINHPAIAQNTFVCLQDGHLVGDLPAHDKFHELIDTFAEGYAAMKLEPLVPEQEIAPRPQRITEPAVDKIVATPAPKRVAKNS